jgi:hypothetical protein
MVIRPAEATFDLSIALVADTLEVTPAQFVEPEHYTWSQLFPNHDKPPPVLLEIIVDNQDAAFSTESAWATFVTDRGYGEDVRYTIVKTPTGQTRDAAWALDVPISHDYRVYAMWAQSQKHASDVPYEINHASGRDVVVVDQTRDGDLWNYLGTYFFEAGKAGQSVAVTNLASTGMTVCADAVRLVPAD